MLVDPAKDLVDHVKMCVHDPNCGKDTEIAVLLSKYEGEGLHKLAANDVM